MKNIYLDIDGVILLDGLSDNGNSALHLSFFLHTLEKGVFSGKYTLYWLTTHCMDGNVQNVLSYLRSRMVYEKNMEKIESLNIRGTVWKHNKTEAIDFSRDFIWFDDDPSDMDIKTLSQHNALDKLVLIDLQENKNHLQDIVLNGII